MWIGFPGPITLKALQIYYLVLLFRVICINLHREVYYDRKIIWTNSTGISINSL